MVITLKLFLGLVRKLISSQGLDGNYIKKWLCIITDLHAHILTHSNANNNYPQDIIHTRTHSN